MAAIVRRRRFVAQTLARAEAQGGRMLGLAQLDGDYKMRVAAIIFLLFTVLFSQRIVSAADPITAHVILPPMIGLLDPVSLPKLDSSARSIAENLFVGLTRYNPLTEQIEPALAAGWSVSDD